MGMNRGVVNISRGSSCILLIYILVNRMMNVVWHIYISSLLVALQY